MQSVLALLGIGLALMGLSIQFSTSGTGWFLFVFAAAIVSMFAAFSDRLRSSPIGAIIGMALVIVAAVGLAMGASTWLMLALVGFGAGYLIAWSAVELPKGRHAHWRFQKRGTVH